ncbi:MAG: hypothetical protein IKS10_08070 [Lachnospiraceae bacterium]|nr:hypothetical protein [Lachnospiraceae bacterium]
MREFGLRRVDAATFQKAFAESRAVMRRGAFLAPPEDNAYEEQENYLAEDGRAGFSITADGWLVSLFSARPGRGFLKQVAPFLRERVEKLVCICALAEGVASDTEEPAHGPLVEAYQKELGFHVVARTLDDRAVMGQYYGEEFIARFVQDFGTPYHVFMTKIQVPEPARIFTDYFEAEAYVQAL